MKEKLNELNEIVAPESEISSTISDNDGPLTVDQLYEKYFDLHKGESGATNLISPKQAPIPESSEENSSKIKKLQKATISQADLMTRTAEDVTGGPESRAASEGKLWIVEFKEDYPGGLVPGLRRPLPRGATVVLPAPLALELKRRFGHVELREEKPYGREESE